ncbi:MAG: NADH-quinone oxidoreductase subunit J [Candidatus Limnocylindrales bacterium]
MGLPTTIPLLGWTWDDLIFVILSGMMLGSALLVVVGRNIIRSGLFMILSFAALAGIYVLIGAPIVAAAQVLIYIGAISVLILFAIMLTQSKDGPSALVFHHQARIAAIGSAFLALILIVVAIYTDWETAPGLAVAVGVAASTTDVAAKLFSDYTMAFEVVSVLLLAAVIGGVFLAKREEAPDAGEASTESQTGGLLPAGDS